MGRPGRYGANPHGPGPAAGVQRTRADDRGKKPRMFTPILVLFAGDAAVTRRIAEEIAETLREEGLATEMRPLAAVRDLAGFGTVVLGAPFEAGRWAAEARAFLSTQKSALIQLPVAVFANATPVEPPRRSTMTVRNCSTSWRKSAGYTRSRPACSAPRCRRGTARDAPTATRPR